MTDQNRKTLRSFYCRDYLWEHFEQMAQELGCSMDYLINESMRAYARDHDQSPGADAMSHGNAAPAGPSRGGGGGLDVGGYDDADANMNHATFERVPAVGNNSGRGQAGPQGPPQRGPSGPPSPGPSPNPGGPPPPPSPSAAGPPSPGQPPGQGPGNWQQSQPSPPQPPGSPGADAGFGGPAASGPRPIYLSFNNNRYVVNKEKYVIGRGSKQTDLTIRDGNISRKHCVILHRNGAYYIKDLGSTNGVEYRGNRIESKKIEEGDVFYLCDYELRFSYHG